METQKWILKLVLGCSLSVALTACSGVSFTPSEVTESLSENPSDGPNDGDGDIEDMTTQESFYPNPQDSKPLVDVLFVIDNSASMVEEQQKLGVRLSSFLSTLKDVNWQIGITTTDTSNEMHGLKGTLVQLHGLQDYVLTKDTPNYETVFANTVVRPEGVNCGDQCPSRVERPLEAVTMAVAKAQTANRGFFREGAELAVVVLSDADEGGSGIGEVMTGAGVLATTALHLGPEKRLTGFGLVVVPGDTACLQEQRKFSPNSFYGHQVYGLAALSGGVVGSICSANYSYALTKIGERVLNLVTEITLSKSPVEGTVQVELSPADPSVIWTVEGKKVKFSKAPAPGTRVDVTYIVQP